MFDNYRKFNETVAAGLTKLIGSMECFYIFNLIAFLWFVSLWWSPMGAIINFVSSNWLQFVLLPLIMVGGAVLNRSAEERAIQDHEMLMTEISTLKEMIKELQAIKDEEDEILIKLTN